MPDDIAHKNYLDPRFLYRSVDLVVFSFFVLSVLIIELFIFLCHLLYVDPTNLLNRKNRIVSLFIALCGISFSLLLLFVFIPEHSSNGISYRCVVRCNLDK